MKIAHLIPQFYPHMGGAEICIHNVCAKLASLGHKAVVVTSTPPPEKKPSLPYEVEHLWSKTGGLFRNLPHTVGAAYLKFAMSKLQNKHNFDLWQITNGYPLGVYAIDWLAKKRIPSVLRVCGDDIQTFPEINYGVRLDPKADAIIKKKYPLYNAFVALTLSVKQEYRKLGISEEKITVIPNGVEIARFAELNKEKKLEIRKKFGVSEDKTLILTVGRYHPKKGYDMIPEIAREIKKSFSNFVWLVVGRDSCEIRRKYPDCEEFGVKCVGSLSSSCTEALFAMPSNELVGLYCAADIFAFPTLIETFGMVLVEAMAAGLPIVSTDAEGVRDVIEDDVTGIKVRAGDSVAFAEALTTVLRNQSRRAFFSANAREKAKSYDWNNVVNLYIRLYEQTIHDTHYWRAKQFTAMS